MSKTKTQPVECVHPMPSTIHSGSALSRIRAPIKTNHIKTREAKQEVAHIPSCPPTSPHRALGPRPALCCAHPGQQGRNVPRSTAAAAKGCSQHSGTGRRSAVIPSKCPHFLFISINHKGQEKSDAFTKRPTSA